MGEGARGGDGDDRCRTPEAFSAIDHRTSRGVAVTSTLAWLDASVEEQRRVREIVQLFSLKESQDELGGRRIVVAIADALFPGTSVLHSRARYLLFIPWFAKAVARWKDPLKAFENLERKMIQAFLDDQTVDAADRLEGLIGRVAGPRVRQLPSTADWTALDEWGILLQPGTLRETLLRSQYGGDGSQEDGGSDELSSRNLGLWHPGVGDLPSGFPDKDIDGGFKLKPEEAGWIKERWLSMCAGTMPAHLVNSGNPPEAPFPWDEHRCLTASSANLGMLHQAERFSLASHGARLVYYLMLEERYLERGYNGHEPDPELMREEIGHWGEAVRARETLFSDWSPREFWDFVRSRNARIDTYTQTFFDLIFDRIGADDLDRIADDVDLRSDIERREYSLKHGNARLSNPKLLAGWQGGLPTPVTFRWPQVSQMVRDVITSSAD